MLNSWSYLLGEGIMEVQNILDVKRGFIVPHFLNKIIHEREVGMEAEIGDITDNRAGSSYGAYSSILQQ